MSIHAAHNGGYFPGLNADGSSGDLSVENRYAIMLTENLFAGEYAIAPIDDKIVWTQGPVTTANYSYAMLQVPPQGGRRAEWRETLNKYAPVMGARNTGTASNPRSIWSEGSAGWSGDLVYNDNHAEFAESPIISHTDFGGTAHRNDHLFQSAGKTDAYLIYSGN